ncbi:uncharacterized protein [Aristolochia californica]|uniref:uncharacterized protein isoform X2 n=1 Tax=Aristolochia californica TaxID=171875 RepID=UPI0035DBF2CA
MSILNTGSHSRRCIGECEHSGCVGSTCFKHCRLVSTGGAVDGPWYMQEPLYLKWKKWDCQSDCGYYCMQEREKERHKAGQGPVKYHDKWPFKCVFGLQEPVSVALSALTLATHFHGWLSFFVLLYYKLPLRPDSKKTYYEYSGFWHIYGLLAMNSWFWSAVSHSRYCDLTQKLDYSSAIALLGYSQILAIIASFNVVNAAARVMVAAPFIAFVTTHILYLNLHKLDLGLNSKVIAIMGVVQLIMWVVWAGVHRHPSRIKLWVVVVGSLFALILDVYDFPPYEGYVDAHALWHATAVPLGYLWWSFVRDDAELRTSKLVRKDE